jgi:hypothetical protein
MYVLLPPLILRLRLFGVFLKVICLGDLDVLNRLIPDSPLISQSESLDTDPQAPDVTVADRNVMDVDRKLMKDENALMSELEQNPIEVDGPSSCELDDEVEEELSQSNFELENERHCLNGDGAEKLNADFCGDLVLSLEKYEMFLSSFPSIPSSDNTSRLRSSILSEIQ